jgi:hypothetical protein
MMRNVLFTVALILLITFTTSLYADVLSIYDIQYTTAADGASPLFGSTVDCAGGVVLDKYVGGKTKLTIYDLNNPDGWGGIFATTLGTEFDDVEPGDVISFSSMFVNEYRGNTQLEFGTVSSFTINGTAALPSPLVVNPADVACPPDAAHSAEKYEAMLLQVQDVTVTAMDLGKASDNYSLQNAAGTCWATDYYIKDETGGATYHPYIHIGADLDSITGIFEQYVKNEWDYYQICTNSFNSVVVPEPVSLSLLLLGAGLALGRRRGH